MEGRERKTARGGTLFLFLTYGNIITYIGIIVKPQFYCSAKAKTSH